MKKLFVLLFILLSFNCVAQLKPLASIELGTNNLSTLIYLEDNDFIRISYPSCSFYSDIYIGLNFKHFYLTSNIVTNFSYCDGYTFNPFYSEYKLDLYYSHKKIKLGYQHLCTHPIVNDNISFLTNISYDKFYIKFTIY